MLQSKLSPMIDVVLDQLVVSNDRRSFFCPMIGIDQACVASVIGGGVQFCPFIDVWLLLCPVIGGGGQL